MYKKKPQVKKPKIIPFTNIQLAFNIAEILGESTPKNRFDIWSYICIVGQDRALAAVGRAKDLHLAGDVTQAGIPHTLGGCWFDQFNDHAVTAHRIRQGLREALNAPPKSTPGFFGYEELTEL